MARSSKRAWKLQEFQSHIGAVNCLAIGHKSGKVMVTGGEDRRVNLWAVGKMNCILSLKGHTTSIDSVKFNSSEDMVAAGSQSGSLKIWNLEASKILRTLSGHKSSVRCLDFHPFGDIIASGSMDTNIKLWDFRRKGCIFTYKGHSNSVNDLQFSPDGKWIVSASDDNSARLWDMMTGKLVAEFKNHSAPVACVKFHPIDFLLVTGSVDKTMKFWDLETFQMVSSTDGDCGPIRCMFMHPEGRCAYAASQDYLTVYGWEPATTFDSVNVNWGRPADIVVHQNQLVGASIQQSNVSIYMANLQNIHPIVTSQDTHSTPTPSSSPFTQNPTRRRSFITKNSQQTPANNAAQGSEQIMVNDERNVVVDALQRESRFSESANYDHVFNPRRELARDLPPVFPHPSESKESLNRAMHHPPKHLTDLPPRYIPPTSASANTEVNNPSTCMTVEPKRPTHLPPAASTLSSKFPSDDTPPQIPESLTVRPPRRPGAGLPPREIRDTPRSKPVLRSDNNEAGEKNVVQCIESPDHHSKTTSNRKGDSSLPPTLRVKTDVDVDDFLPKPRPLSGGLEDEKVISYLRGGHQAHMSVLSTRHRNIQVFKTLWTTGDIKVAVDSAVSTNDPAILRDIVHLLLQKPSSWTLETCSCVLPAVSALMCSRFETHVSTGLNAVKFVLRSFAPIIKDSMTNVASIGVDITREERYNRSVLCHKLLMRIKPEVDRIFSIQPHNLQIKEIRLLLNQLD